MVGGVRSFLDWYKASKRLRRRLLDGRVETSETKQGGSGEAISKNPDGAREKKKKTPERFRTVYPLHRPGSYRLREAQRVRATEDKSAARPSTSKRYGKHAQMSTDRVRARGE